jgi:hypothetical protein
VSSPLLVFFASFSSAYINIDTERNPMGEARGQVGLFSPLPLFAIVLAVTYSSTTSSHHHAIPCIACIVIGSIAEVAIIAVASWVGYKRYQTARSPNRDLVSNSA